MNIVNKNSMQSSFLKVICFYNLLAFIVVVRLFLMGWRANAAAGVPTFSLGVLIYFGIVALFFFSTIALWQRKIWAYITQLLMYVLQLFIIKAGALEFALYFGPQYVITFNSTKANASLGINVFALLVLVLLVLSKRAFLAKK